jgi:hypothetical protein
MLAALDLRHGPRVEVLQELEMQQAAGQRRQR